MPFLRGLIVALAGIIFVFLPGAVISVLTRRDLRYEVGSLLWGIGLLLASLFSSLFLMINLAKPLIIGERNPQGAEPYLLAFVGSLLLAVLVYVGAYLMLRWRNIPAEKLLDTGLMIGFGVGIINNVFQGIQLMGAGFFIILGDRVSPDAQSILAQGWPNLLSGLLALNVYRLALVAISAALGVLVARALARTQMRWLWLAVALGTLSAWTYAVMGLALGADSLTGSLVVIVVEGALAALALWWLRREIMPQPRPTKPIKKAVVDAALAGQKGSTTDPNV